MNVIKEGDNISVHYTGKLETGETFDSSQGKDPLVFNTGAGQMIKGFDDAVIGMKLNEKKTITIKPSEGYGEKDSSRIVELKAEQFGEQFSNIKEGMQISSENGLTGTIQKISENSAIVDFNHFLAGKTLIFEIEIVSIN